MSPSHSLADDAYRPRDPQHQATPSGSLHDPGTPGAAPHHDGDTHAGHVVPLWLLAGILALLLFLTFITVAATWVDLGDLNIWIALAVAAVKGSLVALYFMHLRWDSTFNSLAFVASLIFLALFIGIALMDSMEYKDTFETPTRAQATGGTP